MNIVITIMFLLPVALMTQYLSMYGVFTNRSAFQCTFYILLSFFLLLIGIGGVQLSYLSYDLPATAPLSLTEAVPKP